MESYRKEICVSSLPKINVESLPEYINLVSQIADVWRDYIGPIDYVKNENEFFDEIKEIKEPFPGELIPWFRGNKLSSYKLEPALLRKENPLGISNYLRDMAVDEKDDESVLKIIKGIEGYMKRRFITSGLPYTSIHNKKLCNG